jgi:hypothetical protein
MSAGWRANRRFVELVLGVVLAEGVLTLFLSWMVNAGADDGVDVWVVES